MRDRILLPNRLRQQIVEHALTSPDREVCGLVSGSESSLSAYYPVKNIAADPTVEFLMDPKEQVSAMKRIREAGETMAGIFHSHPGTPARPSTLDRRLAYYPDTIYFILSLLPRPPELLAYYFDGERFLIQPIETDEPA
jgi:proteasome lid subunit RPN8/RPN11